MTLNSCSNTDVPQTEGNSQVGKFLADFFESCQVLVDYEYGDRDLLDVYNVAQVEACLSSSGMFIANVRAAGFTLEVINKDPENMLITAVPIRIGSYAMDKLPQHLEYFRRTVQLNPQHGPRWCDLCLTREESIQTEKKFSIFVAPSLDANHITVIDEGKIYGKTTAEFQ